MNVHPATSLDTVLANLQQYAAAVRTNLVADGTLDDQLPLGLGLWLSEPVVHELQAANKMSELRQHLDTLQLRPFTFNGFPQQNFHQPIVKHQVYLPTWFDESRLSYTCKLAEIMANLLPEGATGSISTLPIGWPSAQNMSLQLAAAARNLHQLAVRLDQIYHDTGRRIVVAIEPEPGCILGDSSSTRAYFLKYLLDDQHAELHRTYLTVCHDVCHAAVMREDQKLQIQAYRECGIRIGKVQVSSAITVNWDILTPDQRSQAFQQVSSFAEDRYLHQTTMRTGPVGSVRFVEDLSKLVTEVKEPSRLVGNWTIHFHVPIHVKQFGWLNTTQSDIAAMLEGLATMPETPVSNGVAAQPVAYKKLCEPADLQDHFTGHFEIETYAWSVLPDQFRKSTLVDDIANEFRFFRQLANQSSH